MVCHLTSLSHNSVYQSVSFQRFREGKPPALLYALDAREYVCLEPFPGCFGARRRTTAVVLGLISQT